MEVNGKITEVKEKVLKGAQSLFFKFGVKSVTMDDVARHLGMSKKTLYQFFNDKDELICLITEDFLKNEESEVDNIRRSAKNAIHELYLMTDNIKACFANMSPSLMYELKKYHPRAFAIFLEHKKRCLQDGIVQNLRKGVEEGFYRSDIDVAVLARLRMEQIETGFDQTVFPSPDFKMEDVQFQLFDHFIHGITSLKGHKLLNLYLHIEEED